jgi:hypothetical protein
MSKQTLKSLRGDQPETVVAAVETMTEASSAAPADESAPPDERDVATLAYRRWLERGCPQGSPDEDWFEAERELQSKSGRA